MTEVALDAFEIVRLRAPGDTSAEIVPAWGGSCIAFRAAGQKLGLK